MLTHFNMLYLISRLYVIIFQVSLQLVASVYYVWFLQAYWAIILSLHKLRFSDTVGLVLNKTVYIELNLKWKTHFSECHRQVNNHWTPDRE